MGEIYGYITEALQNYDNNGLLWIAVILCIIILLFLIWIVARKIRLWYWKVDAQIDTLKSIDIKVAQLGKEKKEEEKAISVNVPGLLEEIEDEIEKIIAKSETKTVYTEQENAVYSKGKQKRVYTEQELEELIRD